MTRVSYESARGCGRRQPGGLYLVSEGIGIPCPLMPVPLHVCPTCGAGIKANRGWTWIEPDGLLPHHSDKGTPRSHPGCPLNRVGLMGDRAGLLWIGEQFYKTPEAWMSEGVAMGFSRRIKSVPVGYSVGKTWVLSAHRKAVLDGYAITVKGNMERYASIAEAAAAGHNADKLTEVRGPGIFHIWCPSAVEYIVKGNESPEFLANLKERGIEAVEVRPAQEAVV